MIPQDQRVVKRFKVGKAPVQICSQRADGRRIVPVAVEALVCGMAGGVQAQICIVIDNHETFNRRISEFAPFVVRFDLHVYRHVSRAAHNFHLVYIHEGDFRQVVVAGQIHREVPLVVRHVNDGKCEVEHVNAMLVFRG